jgi:outer membrane receptor for ferric coprogen and ferric-rhodotorulic acid
MALLCASVAPVQAQPAADNAARSYDIPAQPLGATLARIATEGRQPISIDAVLVQGLTAPAVHGNLSVEQAAQRALAGSGLQLARTPSGALTLQRNGPPAPAASKAPDPEKTDGVYSLREVRVTGKRDGETEGTGAYTSDAVTIGKTAQAMREHPQSVSVFTKQRLEDQNISDLSQAAEQIVGLTVQDTNSRSQQIYSRGFAIDSIQLDGGAPLSASYDNYAELVFDMAEYDRVEVLRGAAGLLNGTGNRAAR